jgi:D-galactarolactone cycloisomerase
MSGAGHPVARIELHRFSNFLPAVLHPAWFPGLPQDENRCTLVRVVTTDGVEGWSTIPAFSREHTGLGDLIGPELIGEDATDIHLVQQRLREISYIGWRNWWIEPAFWDIKAKIAGQPLWRLLGGEDPGPIALYASSAEVRSPEARIEEVEARISEGFGMVKLRIHEDEEADRRQISRVADAVGERVRIAVDANQGWRVSAIADAPRWDLDRALRTAELCSEVGVEWLEEPLPMDAYDRLCELRSRSTVPIAGGELHTTGANELAMMLERGCYDIFQPDALYTGGIAQTIRIARRCTELGLGFSPTTWSNGLGLAINLHLLVASGQAGDTPLEFPLDPPAWVPETRDPMLTSPIEHDGGTLRPPTDPGLGVTVDRRAVRR